MRTTAEQLNNKVRIICELTGLSNNKAEAIKKGQKEYLALENAAIYGGWRLISVGVENGAHYGAFGFGSTDARVKASEMLTKLNGIIAGLEFAENARKEANKVVNVVKNSKK